LKNKKMKIARLEKDMNQEDLAKAVGVTRQTIGMIESGNYNPTLKLCVAICDALDKTLNDLFWTEKECCSPRKIRKTQKCGITRN
jgi:putative transcriptional regulator